MQVAPRVALHQCIQIVVGGAVAHEVDTAVGADQGGAGRFQGRQMARQILLDDHRGHALGQVWLKARGKAHDTAEVARHLVHAQAGGRDQRGIQIQGQGRIILGQAIQLAVRAAEGVQKARVKVLGRAHRAIEAGQHPALDQDRCFAGVEIEGVGRIARGKTRLDHVHVLVFDDLLAHRNAGAARERGGGYVEGRHFTGRRTPHGHRHRFGVRGQGQRQHGCQQPMAHGAVGPDAHASAGGRTARYTVLHNWAAFDSSAVAQSGPNGAML